MSHWYRRYITHRLGLCAGRLLAALLALGCLLVETVTCQTFSPRKVLGHYQQSVWLEEHGLPQNMNWPTASSKPSIKTVRTICGLPPRLGKALSCV
jgi:hypothetical protein